jgi:hypothetical protein
MSELPCFHARPKGARKRGCKKSAKYRVILGRGHFINVCEDHVVAYRGMGYKVIELETVKV